LQGIGIGCGGKRDLTIAVCGQDGDRPIGLGHDDLYTSNRDLIVAECKGDGHFVITSLDVLKLYFTHDILKKYHKKD
jgi:hypothetical protein